MRPPFILLILVFSSLFFSTNSLSQNIPIKTQLEHIVINKDTTFKRNVSVLLKKSEKLIVFPIFYDAELEKISNIQVYKKKGKRYKAEKKIIIREEDVELDYISSKKIKSILIPPGVEAKVSYSIECPELMYFSNLRFFSYNEIDTLKYQVTVPNTFRFIHNTIHKDSLEYITVDSLKSDRTMKWNIEVKPKKIEPDPLVFFGIYKNLKEPMMRTLIIPESYSGNETAYMNDWYLQHIEAKRGLNPKVMRKINELTNGVSDPQKKMNILYSYVKNNFKYVAVEVGMGAFVPTHVNEVFINKQGDCKDLSNFLSEVLNYKGIKSDVAMTATYNHISDCDFPSLISANHLICIAHLDDKPIVLDPTDPIHLPETPVQSLQNRSIFMINSEGGEFLKAPTFTALQNLIRYDIALKFDNVNSVFKGTFKANYEGISGNYIRREFNYANEEDANSVVKKHYETILGNQSISEFMINHSDTTIVSEGNISLHGKMFEDGENRLLFIDFLPRIFEKEERETLLEGTHLGSNFTKKVTLKIQMDKAFQVFNPIEHSFSIEGVSLFLKITSPSESIIECDYEFVSDYVLIERENLEPINEILTAFKKIINEPIIFKNKH